MKVLAVLAVVVFGANAMSDDFLKQTRARVRQMAEQCVTEEKAQMSDLDTISKFQIPESHEGKCVLFCTHKKFNIQNDDGSINKEGAMDTMEFIKDEDEEYHGKILRAFEHCLSTPTDPDPCIYSAALSLCFLNKAKEEGIHEIIVE